MSFFWKIIKQFPVPAVMVLALAFQMAFSTVSQGAEGDADPANVGKSMEAIRAEISSLEAKGSDLTEADKSVIADYQKVLEFDEKILRFQMWRTGMQGLKDPTKLFLEDSTASMSYLQLQELEKKLPSMNKDELILLEAYLTNLKNQYSNARDDYAKYIERGNQMPHRAQETASEITDRTIEINNRLADKSSAAPRMTETMALQAELSYLGHRQVMSQFMLANSGEVSDYLKGRLQAYVRLAEKSEKLFQMAEDNLIRLRNREAQEQAQALEDQQKALKGENLLFEYISRKNREDLDKRNQRIEEINRFKKINGDLSAVIDRIRTIESDLTSQIQYFKNSEYLVQILFNKKNIVPAINVPDNLSDLVSEIRLEQYNVNMELDSLNSFDTYFDYLRKRSGFSGELSEEQKILLGEQMKLRSNLLSGQLSQLSQELTMAVNIQSNANAYDKLKAHLNGQIREALFWRPSAKHIGRKWLEKFPESFSMQWNNNRFSFEGISSRNLRPETVIKCVPLVLLVYVLLRSRKNIKGKIYAINRVIGSPKKDSHWNTPKSLCYIFLLCAPIPLTAVVLGLLSHDLLVFNPDETYLTDPEGGVRKIITYLALFTFMSRVWIELRAKGGISEVQFGKGFNTKSIFRRKVMFWLFALIMILVVWKENEPQTYAHDVIGQLFMIVVPLLLVIPFVIDLRERFSGNFSLLSRIESLFMTGICATIPILAFLGYYYTSVVIAGKLVWTYYILLMYVIIDATIVRSLRLSASRMAYNRKKEALLQARAEKNGEGDTGRKADDVDVATLDDDKMPISEVNEKAKRSVNYVLFLLFMTILYVVWKDILQVVNYLQSITLYTLDSSDGSIKTTVTMMDLVFVGYALLFTTVLVKNFSAILELVLFSWSKHASRWSYTINMVFNYIFIAVCITFVSQKIGITWDKLQWLVAALSVGLGFGLQEIFANFVSGLIILFERPVRIGDIITINGTSGRVTKIRIRATTITDFEKRDYVVPNRAFMTNWSISDECLTRMQVEIGVAYGSDIEAAKETLLRIADANIHVLKTPKSYVLFQSFGESTLNLILRYYIRNISDYFPSIDSLNTEIYNEFNRLGIEFAFNQMDVYIKNTESGQEIRLSDPEMRDLVRSRDDAGSRSASDRRSAAPVSGSPSGNTVL